MERLHYLDFDIKIAPEGRKYRASILHSPAGEASLTFSLPLSPDRLELLINKLGGGMRRGMRRIDSPEMKTARELGGKLFETVFSGDVYACLKESLDAAAREKATGLRIRLRLQDAPELADLPWEFLYNPSRDLFLAQSRKTPIIRYIEMQEAVDPLTVVLPLNVLVMISSPSDYECLNVELEKANIIKALDPLAREGKVRVTFLEDARLPTLRHMLRKGTYHVLHFIGHGGFAENIEEGVLVLEGDSGKGFQANAHRFSMALQDADTPPRLILLNACEGARSGKSDPFASVAATLVRHGTPAVVAMQFAISDSAAITLASEFYTALAEGMPVDAALAEARNMIYLTPNDVEWGTPVLYMRSDDGRLFDVSDKPPARPPEIDAGRTHPEEKPLPEPVQPEESGHQGQPAQPLPVDATPSPSENRANLRPVIPPPAENMAFNKSRLIRNLIIAACVIGFLFFLYYQLEPDQPAIVKIPRSVTPSGNPDAVAAYRHAAEAGDANAQCSLGYLYAEGRGVPQNDSEALRWYRKSAAQHNMFAQYNLGYMYANGRGVARNDIVAARWFRLSAEQGNPAAQYNLGYMYANGRGVERNDGEAVFWFQKAAAQGNVNARQILQSRGLGW